MARIKGIHQVLTHTSGHLHKLSSRLGDSVSREIALKCLVDVSMDFDRPIRESKKAVESLWEGQLTARARQAMATRLEITGVSIFADNVGKVGPKL